MLAAVCTEYGPPEAVRVLERPTPAAEPGHVGVRVHWAAVNFPDVLLIANRYQVSVPVPFVPGSEFAGVIDEVGSGIEEFAIGDRVTGTGIVGAFAQRIAIDPAALTRIPEGMDERTAAAAGVAYRTAYHTLRSVADLQTGDQLVVLGAGGGVGLAAVQLGVALGATVTAVASSAEKLSAATSYGAMHCINHRDVGLREALRETVPDGAHVVIDPVGGALSEPAMRSLRRGGRFVTVGYASGEIPRVPLNLVLIKGITLRGFQFQDVPAAEFDRNEAELRELLTTGRVTPHVGAEYPLNDVAAALRHVADGRAVGKVLIAMNG